MQLYCYLTEYNRIVGKVWTISSTVHVGSTYSLLFPLPTQNPPLLTIPEKHKLTQVLYVQSFDLWKPTVNYWTAAQLVRELAQQLEA